MVPPPLRGKPALVVKEVVKESMKRARITNHTKVQSQRSNKTLLRVTILADLLNWNVLMVSALNVLRFFHEPQVF